MALCGGVHAGRDTRLLAPSTEGEMMRRLRVDGAHCTCPKSMYPGSDCQTVACCPGGSFRNSGTHSCIPRNRPPCVRCRAALRKHATCSACVRRLEIVLYTRYTRVYSPGARAVANRRQMTGIVASSTFARSSSIVGRESSMPVTGTPYCARGNCPHVPFQSRTLALDRYRRVRRGARPSGPNTRGLNMPAPDAVEPLGRIGVPDAPVAG